MDHTATGYADLYPYPGLRPFEFKEGDIFFGRGIQIDQMLTRLEEHRFLAVVGASGSGKSSLVRAGLLPALKEGFLSDTGSDWRFVVMRPGAMPFSKLAVALLKAADRSETDPQAVARMQATLRSGPQGLAQAVENSNLEGEPHVLVLVDQFEEIFRFRHRDQSNAEIREVGGKPFSVHEQRNEAAAFVNLLLATARQSRVPIHIVLTMRSDFLGDCDVFHGLPEAVSNSQFLTPRLTRSQLKEAINGPLELLNAKANPAVVTRIINETGTDPDLLPLMQHLLTRMWLTANFKAQNGESVVLNQKHYEEAGGLEEALSLHVDKVFNSLGNPEKKRVAEKAFRALCDWSAENRLTRRLVTVEEVAKVADVSWELVANVLTPFLYSGRNFLVSSDGQKLNSSSIIDISHEALIRQWRRLADWVEAERASAGRYLLTAETARRWKAGKASLWRSPELDLALKWREEEAPTEAWAQRYDPDFLLGMEFLDASRKARMRQRLTRIGAVGGAFIAVLLFAFVAFLLMKEADKATNDAIEAKMEAEEATEKAKIAEGVARKAEGNTKTALVKLKESVRERGRTWLKRAKGHSKEGNNFASALMAAESIGFEGLGAKNDQEFATSHPRLLDEELQKEANEAVKLAKKNPRSGLPIWQSSVEPKLDESVPPQDTTIADFKGVSGLAMSPDGRLLAAAGLDGKIRIWNLQTGKQKIPVLEADGREFHSLSFSHDGTILASGGNKNDVKLWDVASGQPLVDKTSREGPEKVEVVEVVPTSEGLVEEEEEDLPTRVLTLAFSSDGQSFASGGDDGVVRLWTWSGKTYEENFARKEHENSVLTLAYSPLGNALASGGDSGKIVLWMVDSDKEGFEPHVVETQLKHKGNEVVSLAFSPDGKLLASGSADESILIGKTEELMKPKEERAEPWRLGEHVNRITSIAFSQDSGTLASSSKDGVIKLWPVKEIVDGHPKPIDSEATLTGHQTGVTSLVFSPDGKTLVGASERDSIVRIWQVEAPETKGSAPPNLAAYLAEEWCELDGRNIRYFAANDFPKGREFGFLNLNKQPHTHLDILQQEGKTDAQKAEDLEKQFEKAGNWRSAKLVSGGDEPSKDEQTQLDELKALELAWIEALEKSRIKYPLPGQKSFTVESVQMEMVWVEKLNGWVGDREVTVKQFTAGGGFPDGDQGSEIENPVHSVTWTKANKYCNDLTKSEGERNLIPPGYHFSLPTDEQWKAYVGTANAENSVYLSNKAKPVDGTRKPNNHGLYDVRGNLWEWTRTTYGGGGQYGLRGGSYKSNRQQLTNAGERHHEGVENPYYLYGFRCVLVKPE
jgi:WD40 repeat protein/energy-coupling factor transporter ATP-binding protein EcfA2